MENKQEKINYPNRFAKQIRNSPELSNLLDGEGMGAVEMEKQQMKAMEHEQAEQAVRQAGGTAQVLRAIGRTANTQDFSIGDDNIDNTMAQMRDDIETVKEEEERKEKQKKSDVLEQQQQNLSEVGVDSATRLMLVGGASSSSQPMQEDSVKQDKPPPELSVRQEREEFIRQMKLPALKNELKRLGLVSTGRKAVLVERLLNFEFRNR